MLIIRKAQSGETNIIIKKSFTIILSSESKDAHGLKNHWRGIRMFFSKHSGYGVQDSVRNFKGSLSLFFIVHTCINKSLELFTEGGHGGSCFEPSNLLTPFPQCHTDTGCIFESDQPSE